MFFISIHLLLILIDKKIINFGGLNEGETQRRRLCTPMFTNNRQIILIHIHLIN